MSIMYYRIVIVYNVVYMDFSAAATEGTDWVSLLHANQVAVMYARLSVAKTETDYINIII